MSIFYKKITLSHNRPLIKHSGFTLLEILLVVGIIAILAGIVIIAINPSKTLATVRNSERKSDLKQINSALTQYYMDNNEYPASLTSVSSLTEICDTGTATSGQSIICTNLVNLSELVPKYLTAIPTDPSATTTSHSGYKVIRTGKKIGLSASAELNQTITIGTVPPPIADYSCGVATDANCWSDEVSKAWNTTNFVNTAVTETTNTYDGKANTAILYGLGTTYEAGYYCYTLEEDGVPPGTWYLPSYAELWSAWNDSGSTASALFTSELYWSSTEYSLYPNNLAWALYTNADVMGFLSKTLAYSVRCLR
jgi:prepilin-type N-terminal cleavage/methylation domain-containing protein